MSKAYAGGGAEIDCVANRVALRSAASIPALVKILYSDEDREKEAAATQIVALARDEKNVLAVIDSGVFHVLVELSCRGTDRQKELATETLARLGSLDEGYKAAIVNAATMEPLRGLEKLNKRKQVRYAKKSYVTPETTAIVIACVVVALIAWKATR